jgi:TPR repeat protein
MENEKKRIDEEGSYNIVQNSKKELMFCIGEYEGGPDSPHIVYNGGALAVLYRNQNHAVILDEVNPEARESLKLAKEVLIAECAGGGGHDLNTKQEREKLQNSIVRDYVAQVQHRAPEDDGEVTAFFAARASAKQVGGDKDDERQNRLFQATRLHTAKEFDKSIPAFETLANEGYAPAQYMMGFFHFNGDGIEQDFEKAIEYYLKAAEQGHPMANVRLEELQRQGIIKILN